MDYEAKYNKAVEQSKQIRKKEEFIEKELKNDVQYQSSLKVAHKVSKGLVEKIDGGYKLKNGTTLTLIKSLPNQVEAQKETLIEKFERIEKQFTDIPSKKRIDRIFSIVILSAVCLASIKVGYAIHEITHYLQWR